MPLSDNDLSRTPESEFGSLSQDDLLRIVVNCRESRDRTSRKRARAAWGMLIAHDIDRVRNIVASFRLKEHAGVKVALDMVDDVVQDCYMRLLKMLRTFRGTSEGEYRAAMRTCIGYECRDHLRRELVHDRHRAGSLDEETSDAEGSPRPKFDTAVAKKEHERVDAEEALEREHERRKRLEAAIARIEKPDQRRVVDLTYAGRTTEEIMEELGTSRDNVYQLRSRGLKDLQSKLEEDDES